MRVALKTAGAPILMVPPPLVPSFAPLLHMYARPGSLLYKKPSIWDKNSAFFAIFFRHWIKGFQWRFLYRNAREGCKYNAYHAEKVIFLWIFVKNPLIMILRSFFIVKSTPFQWIDWTSAEQSWFRSYYKTPFWLVGPINLMWFDLVPKGEHVYQVSLMFDQK